MAIKNLRKKPPVAPAGGRKGKKRPSSKEDPFFLNQPSRKKRVMDDDVIDSGDSDEDDHYTNSKADAAAAELPEETAAEMRLRMANAVVNRLKEDERKAREEEEGSSDDDTGRDHSRVAQILEQEQLEQTGRARRAIAAKVQKPETADGFRLLAKHRQPVTAVALSEDDLNGFSASKDGTIIQWDVESGRSYKYQWPAEEVLKSHGSKDPQGRAVKHSKNVSALAVSSDGRYLATGGLDRHVHLWDTRTRQHLQAFPGHRAAVSCLTFRQGTTELFSGSFDRTVKIWNAEDRVYIDTLCGHQSEVLTIDCLRKERLLTVGRDRSMQLWKVPEVSRLVFRAPASSLECGSFINNEEFLSGSDDGSIELWNMLRKKPVFIIKNAHATQRVLEPKGDAPSSNGHIGSSRYGSETKYRQSANSWISSVTVCRDSDLAASGAGDGAVRLWGIKSESRRIQPLFDLPLVGFVNSLAFARSGQFVIAGVGQEPRLGRWARCLTARNGVLIHPLKLSQDDH